MSVFQATIYGLIQGVGEFLPISSSGHLVLLPWLFGWQDPGLSFDVSLHFGTLIAVVLFFWKDFLGIILSAAGKSHLVIGNRYSKNYIWLLFFATIPAGAAGFLLDDFAETALRDPKLIAFTLTFFGALLYFVDKRMNGRISADEISSRDAFMIGCAQAVAIVPGVSRSGATITAGLARGLSREQAARFSFLLSAPIIFGAFILKAGDFFTSAGPIEFYAVAVSAISGYAAIAGLLKLVQKTSYKFFFWYRIALSALIAALLIFK
jgi:undecaprenyl-diphosphatase